MVSHLIEIRRRCIRIIIVFSAFFLLFFYYANELFHLVVSPLLGVLPMNNTLIATQITSPLMTPIQLAFNVALLTTCPFLLIQMWQFIAPGLYQHERQKVRGIVIMSFILFCLGIAFCFYIVLPFLLRFFVDATPAGVQFMPDMVYAIHFICRMLLLFGLSFQVPLLCLLLVRLGLVDLSTLKTIRPYIIVAAFIVGMLLTPPDIFSQILLAVPLCILYELGIISAKFFGQPTNQAHFDESDSS